MPNTYEELRSRYDLAFQELARESKRVNELQLRADGDGTFLTSAQERLTATQLCYLQARNALASYLLSLKSECQLAISVQQRLPKTEERSPLLAETACASC